MSDWSSDVCSSDLVGRQAWTVYNVLTTAESVSPLAAPAVAASLLAFVVVYFAVFGAGTFYVLRLMGRPPEKEPVDTIGAVRAAGITAVQAIERSEEHKSELQSLMSITFASFCLNKTIHYIHAYIYHF